MNEVSHKGRILTVGPDIIRVEIISSSACTACHAAGLCSMAEAVKKEVEIPVREGESYGPGEEVEVLLQEGLGMKAVVVSYVIPLFILLLICIPLSYTGLRELYVGLAGISGVALYYLILYMVRGHFSKEYVFSIRKYNNLNSRNG